MKASARGLIVWSVLVCVCAASPPQELAAPLLPARRFMLHASGNVIEEIGFFDSSGRFTVFVQRSCPPETENAALLASSEMVWVEREKFVVVQSIFPEIDRYFALRPPWRAWRVKGETLTLGQCIAVKRTPERQRGTPVRPHDFARTHPGE